jgi:hypothetical protein
MYPHLFNKIQNLSNDTEFGSILFELDLVTYVWKCNRSHTSRLLSLEFSTQVSTHITKKAFQKCQQGCLLLTGHPVHGLFYGKDVTNVRKEILITNRLGIDLFWGNPGVLSSI